jgi:hypothetical protein
LQFSSTSLSACEPIYIHDDQDLREENSFNGMFTLEIIYVLSYPALDGNETRTPLYKASDEIQYVDLKVVTERFKALLNLEHDMLLMDSLGAI